MIRSADDPDVSDINLVLPWSERKIPRQICPVEITSESNGQMMDIALLHTFNQNIEGVSLQRIIKKAQSKDMVLLVQIGIWRILIEALFIQMLSYWTERFST